MRYALTMFATAILCVASGCGQQPPQVVEDYVRCRTMAGDRTAVKLLAWEFDSLSDVLTRTIAVGEEATLTELTSRVHRGLSPELRDSLQDPDASIQTTLLELEVRGVLTSVSTTDDNNKLRRTL